MNAIIAFFLTGIAFLIQPYGVSAQPYDPKPVVLHLQPGPGNPRNSEGDFITLKGGRILFVYSRYTGNSPSDHAPADLMSRYSDDGGKAWSTEDQLVLKREGDMNVMSVSLLRLKNGKIALFYLRKNSEQDCLR